MLSNMSFGAILFQGPAGASHWDMAWRWPNWTTIERKQQLQFEQLVTSTLIQKLTSNHMWIIAAESFKCKIRSWIRLGFFSCSHWILKILYLTMNTLWTGSSSKSNKQKARQQRSTKSRQCSLSHPELQHGDWNSSLSQAANKEHTPT